MVNSCADIEAEFRETERDGQRGADCSPQDGAGIGMDAGRNINRDDWFPGTVDEFDGFTIGSGYFGGQSSAEEGIDENVAGGEEAPCLVIRPESTDRRSPRNVDEPTIHGRGIATQIGDRREKHHLNPSASAA